MRTVKSQTSETLRIGIFLTLSGGFQDAYSYLCRGKVFANAQTGNIVLLGQSIAEKNITMMFRYLCPLIAFVLGAYISQRMKSSNQKYFRFHWRQHVLLLEMLLIVIVGFLPEQLNILANIILSFVCAMQVVAFSKFHGNSYATTMCIGNLRSATTLLCQYHITKDKNTQRDSFHYFFIIFVFLIGATLGTILGKQFHLHSIWFAILFLFVAFIMMFYETVESKHLS